MCLSSKVSTVWRDPTLLLQCKLHLGVFVQLVTTASRAALFPHRALLAFTKIRLEERVKTTVNRAPSVNEKWFNTNLALLCTKFFILFEDVAIEDVLTVWTFLTGWFQESSGQAECVPCPPGFHCQSLSPSPLLCPAGYICPNKSLDSQPLPCPRGTYNPSQGLTTTGNIPES